MRWKLILGLALLLTIATPASCTLLYRNGFRSAVFHGILEAGRLGVFNPQTANQWALDVDDSLSPKTAPNP